MRRAKTIRPEEAKRNKREQEGQEGTATAPPAHEPADPSLLTTRETAALLRVHPKQVYRLLRQGLPALRVGGEWRLARADVLAWASQRGLSAAPDEPQELAAEPGPAPPLVAANGDVAVWMLLGSLPQTGSLAGFVQADRGSGLELLRARRVLAAGVHGELPPARLGGERLVMLYLAEREVGLVFPRGARLQRPSDVIARRVATRPVTAGIRRTFDAWLATAGLTAQVHDEAKEYASHEEVVLAVARGEAEVGVATCAWARRLGLGFLPLASELYALAMTAGSVGTGVGVALCEVAQSKALRQRLDAAGGYSTANTGLLRFESDLHA